MGTTQKKFKFIAVLLGGSIHLLSQTATAARPKDQLDFLNFIPASVHSANSLSRIQRQLEVHSALGDTAQLHQLWLQEAYIWGQNVGDLIQDAVILEALELQLTWGARDRNLLGTTWTAAGVAKAAEQTRILARKSAQAQLKFFYEYLQWVNLKESSDLKKNEQAEAEIRALDDRVAAASKWSRENSSSAGDKRQIGFFERLKRAIFQKSGAAQTPTETMSVEALEKAKKDVYEHKMTDVSPLHMTITGPEDYLAMTPEFAREYIAAHWRGLTERAGQWIQHSDLPSERIQELARLVASLESAGRFSDLPLADSSTSCVAKLALRARN